MVGKITLVDGVLVSDSGTGNVILTPGLEIAGNMMASKDTNFELSDEAATDLMEQLYHYLLAKRQQKH